MKEYKAIALDIDGTLTNTKKEVTSRTKKAITRAQEEGKIIIVASGRPIAGIRGIEDTLELETKGGYILAFNGARIKDCKTGEIIYQNVMPREIVPVLYNEAKEHQVSIITYEGDDVICGCNHDSYVDIEAKINKIKVRDIENFDQYITFDVNKCLMTGEPEKLAILEKEMQQKYGDQLSIYRSEPYFLEFMPLNVDKANSLSHLLEILGLTKEELIAMGDGFNDLSMIQYAGLGVAMDNAQDIVKEHADLITKSNEEDGVAHIIEEYML
ncbi:Cof-type HAD-IIB family hydrolase [Anaerosporobacter faecicola]|uniref:Cof-type HAD-IIB family hydrolase n=1 Tax=Anaerosporobacter faecicola TaxID=2718714 RepID=UPI00143B5D6F|nr:Cof-type HAD-IIB family hydrolase [Anaerosporobacter faecicola]